MKQILLIDDDLFFADLVRDVLKTYQIEHCQDAIEAFAWLDQYRPDAIILDLLMPASTGFNLLHELISNDQLNAIPLIICSAAASEVDHDFLEAAGTRAILDKNSLQPIDIALALKRLNI